MCGRLFWMPRKHFGRMLKGCKVSIGYTLLIFLFCLTAQRNHVHFLSYQRRVIIIPISTLCLASLVPDSHLGLCGLLTLRGKVK
jgi:hypothetical protein